MLIDTYTPSTSMFRIDEINGLAFYHDPSRDLWISTDRTTVTFALPHRQVDSDRWMKMIGGYSNKTGYPVTRKSVITSITARTENNANCMFYIRKEDLTNPNGYVDLHSLEFELQNEKTVDSLNIQLDENDLIKTFLDVRYWVDPEQTVVNYPVVTVEMAWIKQS